MVLQSAMFSFDSLISVIDPVTIEFTIDLLLAVAIGFLIGAERELRGKDAGISTHTFVICGAMLFTFMSMTVDPASKSRIAAQIVTGIGFLGAGLILKDGTSVRNLTTAASIWYAGAIGMAIGFGFHQIAIVATIASVLIPRIPHVRRAPVTTVEPLSPVVPPQPSKDKEDRSILVDTSD